LAGVLRAGEIRDVVLQVFDVLLAAVEAGLRSLRGKWRVDPIYCERRTDCELSVEVAMSLLRRLVEMAYLIVARTISQSGFQSFGSVGAFPPRWKDRLPALLLACLII
jgi:hypothetical protein